MWNYKTISWSIIVVQWIGHQNCSKYSARYAFNKLSTLSHTRSHIWSVTGERQPAKSFFLVLNEIERVSFFNWNQHTAILDLIEIQFQRFVKIKKINFKIFNFPSHFVQEHHHHRMRYDCEEHKESNESECARFSW